MCICGPKALPGRDGGNIELKRGIEVKCVIMGEKGFLYHDR